jgi:D-cysteine desulfhydrase
MSAVPPPPTISNAATALGPVFGATSTRETTGSSVVDTTSRIALAALPTPVERLHRASVGAAPGSELWVKRDDRSSPLYGGNKVRKLEYLLADALGRGSRRVVTVGAAGSHHVLATGIFGKALGLGVRGILVPQPSTPHVLANLRADIGAGVQLVPCLTWLGAAWSGLTSVLGGHYAIPPGGSSVLGALGYVYAAFELAAQVRAGLLPEPDLCVVATGSGSTAAGLAAGFQMANLKTNVAAIVVAEPAPLVEWSTRRLHRRLLRRLEAPCEDARLELHRGFLGAGYGYRTKEGALAEGVAMSDGLSLDATYTEKAFAAALQFLAQNEQRRILYWHTLSAVDLGPLIAQGPGRDSLDAPLSRLLR